MKTKNYSKNQGKGFHIFGRNAVSEAIAGAPEKIAELLLVQEKGEVLKNVEDLVNAAKSADIRVSSVEKKRAEKIAPGVHTQGVIAYYTGFNYLSYKEFEEMYSENSRSCVLVLDGVEDVGNFGAIIRSAVAMGVDAILVSDFNQAPVNATTFKTSAGAVTKIDIVQFSGMGQIMQNLKSAGYWSYGVDMPDPEAEIDPYTAGNIWEQKYDDRTAFILGAEGKGISQKAKEACDFLAPIPMENDVESLNVSVAAAIALYEWKRQQMMR